jgi:hypothetical protein
VNVGAQLSEIVGTYLALGTTTMFMSYTARAALMVDFSPTHWWSIGLGPSVDWMAFMHLNDGSLFNQGVMFGVPLRLTFRPMRQESRGEHQGAIVLVDTTPGVVLPHDGFGASFGFSWFFGIGWETH